MPKHKGTFAVSMGFLFLVCLLGLMPMFVRAQSTGSISGRVTDESGVAIQNIKVVLYTRYDWGYPFNVWVGETLTDAGGNYAFVGLAAPEYAVKFTGNGLNYISEWHQNQDGLSSSPDPIGVSSGASITGIDAQLAPGGRISGCVTDHEGAGIPGIYVGVYDTAFSYPGVEAREETVTDANGLYGISGVPSGNRYVHFGHNSAAYFPEWYNDKTAVGTADSVPVSIGAETPNINAQLRRYGQISGRVTDSSGVGISDIKVLLYNATIGFSGEYLTDADGYYTAACFDTASYRIYFSRNGHNYISEWYANKADIQSADLIPVSPDETIQNINAQLTTGGQITGRVTDSQGNGLGGVDVIVYAHLPSNIYSQVSDAVTNANGDYAAGGLDTGQYVVGFFHQQFQYHFEYYNDKQSYLDADDIAVSVGQVTANIDAQLADRHIINLSQTAYWLEAMQNGPTPEVQTCAISNLGAGALNWTATSSADWLSLTPAGGTGNGTLNIQITRTDLAFGAHQGFIYISDAQASNSPQIIIVDFKVLGAPPFGSLDAPAEGAIVASSVPVTGWALDDIGVPSVKIYCGSSENDRIYIGDATFVKGARPDVEEAYPYYPQPDRAGWGYMLLTNFLPNGGNGTFTLLAYATDTEGHEVLLGSKTIICDNANAVKPFGAIDTPAQGGTASGAAFLNFGWALTPQPNSIPIDGSTLNVWVDGLPLGHPVYNNYRADIATLFPGYANSNGAAGFFTLDTTGYVDGVHTIEWSATDSGGNTDGIGSRYFTIQYLSGSSSGVESAVRVESRITSEIAALPEDVRSPVYAKRGLAADAPAEMILPEADGVIRISIPQVTRLAVYLNQSDAGETEAEMIERGRRIRNGFDVSGGSEASGDERIESQSKRRERGVDNDIRESRMSSRSPASPDSRMESRSSARYEAYQLDGEKLRPLPIGASFNPQTGAFYWQPGPGFFGEFRFVIVDSVTKTRKTILVTIH